ncbi:MAG: DNA repair protein RecO [Candidatus Daviesbacteria bacterium]|nr:MAG: DNA repair protein RecO [Candidatus Daviesbacteria bacterium]
MFSFKTEGIILKRRNFGEADRILTVFSQKKGKISVLAKGVRRITSRRAGNVELLNRAIMYFHQGKGMPILTEAESLDTYPKLKADLTLSTYAYHLIELVDKITAEGQENQILYEYLVRVLEKLSRNPRQILIRAFEVKILSVLGFATFFPSNPTSTPGVSIQIRKILEDLQNFDWDQIEKMQITEIQALELERYLRYYIERTLEGQLKSRQFLKQR